MIQLGTKIDLVDKPLLSLAAAALALFLAFWAGEFWGPRRHKWARRLRNLPALQSHNISFRGKICLLLHRIFLMLALSMTSSGLVFVVAYSLCMRTAMPVLLLRLKVAAVFSALLMVVSTIYIRLRRQPPRRHGRHDAPVMEL